MSYSNIIHLINLKGRHDTQSNNTQRNDTQHYDTEH
jgi:hypothetical protein